MPSGRQTRAEKQADTRRRVLDAAATVFPQRGFHGTTVEQVAAHAGMSIGAVYSNFDSKAALFLALYERQMDRWVRELDAVLKSGGDAASQLRAAAAYWQDFHRRERDWFVLHMEFWGHVMRHGALREPYARQFRRLRTATAQAIEQGASDAGISLPLAAGEVATLLQALNRGLLLEAYADQDEFPGEALEALVDLFLPAVDDGGGASAREHAGAVGEP